MADLGFTDKGGGDLTTLWFYLNTFQTFFSPVAAIFKEMMTKAKSDFHTMFKKTYGIIYEQNAYVFTDLFDELERYNIPACIGKIECKIPTGYTISICILSV